MIVAINSRLSRLCRLCFCYRLNSGLSAVISNYASASLRGTAPGADAGATHITDDERRCILEEEQRQLDQMKVS
jgi:hypothetical protein